MTPPGKSLRESPFEEKMDIEDLTIPAIKSPPIDHAEEDQSLSCDTSNTDSPRTARYMNIEEMHKRARSDMGGKSTLARDRLSSKQKSLIRHWKDDFWDDEDDVVHPNEHMIALATAIKSESEIVLEYIKQQHHDNNLSPLMGSRPSDISLSREISTSPRDQYSLVGANAHLSSTTLTLINKYVSACRRRRSQTDGRRSVNTGPYRCTFGCGYRTKRAFDWRRHEETHEPQELWLCELCCQKDTLNPFLVNRKDKFLRHAADKHADYRAERVLNMSKVRFVPRAAERCPFCRLGEAPKAWSWDERCKHVLGHFEDEVEMGLRRPTVTEEREHKSVEAEDQCSVTSGISEESRGNRIIEDED